MLTVITLLCAEDFSFMDDFSKYTTEGSVTANWMLASDKWKVVNGAFTSLCEGKEFTVVKNAPAGTDIKAEAVITIKKGLADQWKIAGVIIFQNPSNYWHVALVEGPKQFKEAHFIELSQNYNGQWNYNKNVNTIDEKSISEWKFNTPYRVRLVMNTAGITGTVKAMDGSLVWEKQLQFTADAVKSGKPGVDSSYVDSEFREFRTKVK